MLCTELEKLEEIIEYKFKDISLLATAMTHSSYANDNLGNSKLSNERFEFLGDALLDAIVGELLFRHYPEKDEGFLTKLRAEIVCEKSLSSAAMRLGINRFLRLGKGEEERGGRKRSSIVADSIEALIAAVYLDSEKQDAIIVLERLINRILGEVIDDAVHGRLVGDSKTALQEKCQSKGITDIKYEIVGESGPDHDKRFTAAVFIDGKERGRGTGKTKKEAESLAAHMALNHTEA